ncbi:molybdenum cofactor guanylyltransferase [soil metagenome]
MNPIYLTGFVLAGGKSARMGADKFALEIDGETFLDRAVNVLSPVCKTVKIVLNDDQNIETKQPVIRDIYKERGALGGIHAALKNCETKFAVILAVDLPFVTTEALENLGNLAFASNKYIAVVPRQTDGRAQPLCAVYRSKYCLPTLEKLLMENNTASVRDFLGIIFPKYIEQNRLSENENLLLNINSPSDLYKIEPSI